MVACQGVDYVFLISTPLCFKVLDTRGWLCSEGGNGTSESSKWGVPGDRKLLPIVEHKHLALELSWKELSRKE